MTTGKWLKRSKLRGPTDEHPSEGFVSAVLARYRAGEMTRDEVVEAVLRRCHEQPAAAAALVRILRQHPEESARGVGGDVQELLRRRAQQVKDIEQIRRSSPLRPGSRLALGGGYTAAYSRPWWLNGRECYLATFIDFAARGAGEMPVARVALDDEIDMVEAGGRRHRGRHALLKLLHVADWAATETVTVHVVESLPDDVGAFYAVHPFGTEIESHATYTLVTDDQGPGPDGAPPPNPATPDRGGE